MSNEAYTWQLKAWVLEHAKLAVPVAAGAVVAEYSNTAPLRVGNYSIWTPARAVGK